ncbi:hypothetical protein [Lacrimispora saccharolytica]|uniref:hypothetical protein n=1 Tax=Lacrimispora saccharolytica TaxID=84030 RepID=UPI00265D1327|nr:hypothetical protein [Lacrimispora saccharolytica]MCF2655753.1 hypothetical protein [Lacrimispora saccharolytica]
MKRKVVNEKVIRAMAIGISAMLATATPMTAMAAEGEGDNPEAPQAGGSEAEVNTVVDTAQAASESAEASVEAAKEPVETVTGDVVTGDVETKVVPGEAGTDAKGNDLAQVVIDAAVKLAGDATGNDLTKADTTIETTADNLDAAEGAIVSSDSSLNNAEDAFDDANDAANEAVKAVTEANDAIDAKAGDISNAETIDEANAAYDELVDIADEAEATFNTKLEEYNEAKSAYESAAADVEKYEQAYADAVALADSNAEAARVALEAAKDKADALEAALLAAKASVDESAKAAIAIAEKEKAVDDSAGLNWKEEDKLFILIMENYYLPEKSNISGAKVTRVQGKDNDEYNYFKAVYTDETGKKCEKYFNFKLGENNKTKNEMIIFEKREVEIFGDPNETPDRYVDSTGAVKNIDKGLKDGSIIAVVTDNGDGTQSTKYFETAKLGNATVGDVIESTTVTDTSTEDITVGETTETYKFDEEGNLVKEVTADVTTITYTEASFTSETSYASDAERDAAAAERDAAADAKQIELEDAGAKIVDVNTTYVITGTYIPTFTKTVNVNNQEVEWDHGNLLDEGVKTKEEAYEEVKNDVEDNLKKEHQDWYIVDTDYNLKQTGTTKGKPLDDPDFLISGTVTATYAKITKETVDKSTFGALWEDLKSIFGAPNANKKLEEATRAAIEADGGIFVEAKWFDGGWDKATIRYVKAEKVESDACGSVAEAEASLAAKIRAQLGSATGTYNTESETKYSFNISYLEKSNEKKDKNKVVRTETYKDAETLKGEIIQNKNFLDGEDSWLMTRQDKDFRAFVDNGVAITGKYATLLDEAKAATEAVAKAQAKVNTLNNEIDELKKSRESNLGALRTLSEKLATAELNLEKAEGVLEEIKGKLEDAGVELEDVIERLTPAPGTPGTPGAPATEDGAPGEGPATVVTTTTTTTTPATNLALAGAGNAGGANAGNAGNDANAGDGGIVNIDDEETALAASVDDVDDTANVVEIGDEETPLAASVDNETMSWWWLLLIALLGATGYEMYRKHQQKKEALAETDDVQ